MGLFFGTDGLRGKVNEVLTYDVAYKIGNALSILKEKPTIVVGSDTRITNTYIVLALSVGAMSGGANVIDLGILPTAGVAYITKMIKADYGVVISASHNSAEYNGIKIFNSEGYKLGDKEEERIERCFIREKLNHYPSLGFYKQSFSLTNLYYKFLIGACSSSLKGKKIVLDCANGASYKIAPRIFRKLGACVIASNSKNDGKKINDNCGAVHPENLSKKVLQYKADMGFSYDGDADRVIAVDEKGKIIDGDAIVLVLSKYFKKKDKLKVNTVVGTSHTNYAVEEELKKCGIDLLRTDVGDKYVLAKMLEKDLSIGGEQSGHIILKDFSTTGDGILTSIIIVKMLVEENIATSKAFEVELYPQANKDVVVEDKFRIMNNEELSKEIFKYNSELSGVGRVMIRASGTEPKIRVMVESKDKELNEKIADALVETIKRIK